MIIYKTTNLLNGKFYVGKDSNNYKNYYGSGIALKHAIKKYGKENFKKEILEHCQSFEELNEKEIYWIEKLNAIEEGYNMSKGGDGFSGITQDTIDKIVHKNTGKKRTQAQRDNISKALADKPKSDTHKLSLKKAWVTRPPYTKETLDRKSNSMLGKNSKKYEVTSPDGLTYEITCLNQFCKDNNLKPSNMVKVANNERPHHKKWKCKRI